LQEYFKAAALLAKVHELKCTECVDSNDLLDGLGVVTICTVDDHIHFRQEFA